MRKDNPRPARGTLQGYNIHGFCLSPNGPLPGSQQPGESFGAEMLSVISLPTRPATPLSVRRAAHMPESTEGNERRPRLQGEGGSPGSRPPLHLSGLSEPCSPPHASLPCPEGGAWVHHFRSWPERTHHPPFCHPKKSFSSRG